MTRIYKSAAGEKAVRDRYLQILAGWPVVNQHVRVPTREGETFIVASGPVDAPPVLLLHGSGFNSTTWMGDVAAWAANFRVYAVDVIGHPGLSAPSRPRYDSEDYALWLDDVLRELTLTRTSIVGISLGGWLGIDYATRRPERVERLVLMCPGGVGKDKISMFKLLFLILPLLAFGGWGRRRAMTIMLGPTPFDGADPAARAVTDFMSLISKHFRQNTARVSRFSDAVLQRLTMPVLLIVGARDPMIDSAESKDRLVRNARHVVVHVLGNVGHAVVGQTALVLEFLRDRKLVSDPDLAARTPGYN